MDQSSFQSIPQVDKLLKSKNLEKWDGRISHEAQVKLARNVLDQIRQRVGAGEVCPPVNEIESLLETQFEKKTAPTLVKCINATGVLLHTNLGRAPVGKEILNEMAESLAGYSTLEIDVATAQRGGRTTAIESLLCELTGVEGALVVNNCASALFLILHTLANQREVLISRSELVQIGGGFRIPEILEASNAILKEVGTTNITSLSDYERNVHSRTGMILKVYQSNFQIQGHVDKPSLSDLFELAKKKEIPFVVDYGSGLLKSNEWISDSVERILKSGASLVTFSGDKLLGGPQAGIILGPQKLIQKLQKSPLYRALRLGKFDLFILERVLLRLLSGKPTFLEKILFVPEMELEERANAFSRKLTARKIANAVVRGTTSVGGGSAPEVELPAFLVEIPVKDVERIALKLSQCTISIQVRKQKDSIALDLRTVLAEEENTLLENLVCRF